MYSFYFRSDPDPFLLETDLRIQAVSTDPKHWILQTLKKTAYFQNAYTGYTLKFITKLI